MPRIFCEILRQEGHRPVFLIETGLPDCYTSYMGKKLGVINFYMLDPDLRRKSVYRSVASSSAIEGIRAPFAKKNVLSVDPTSKFRAKSNGKSRLKRS